MAKRKFEFDLIVLGTGAGGSAAANIAAKNGLKVAVVENDLFGGESPNYGEIPVRALAHATKIIFEAKQASRLGIRASISSYNFQSLKKWKDLAIQRTGAHDNKAFYEKSGITTFRGTARFINPHEISVNQKHLSAEKFLIATGSKFEMPEIANLRNVEFYTPRTILNIDRPPKSIFIIGGGAEAVEIAQILAILGTKVYISEISARLLPKEDEEVGITLENFMVEKMKIFVLPQTRVVAVEKDQLNYKVVFQRGGSEKFIRVDEVMVAGVRKPNLDIGLENANVEYSSEGIIVNDFLQTSAKHIFAAGSVISEKISTAEALLQSRIAANNIHNPRRKISPQYNSIPRTIATIPEIASVGLTEDDCIKRDLPIKTAIAPLNLIARSNTEGFQNGFVKLICDRKGKILGGSIVAPEASSAIQEISLTIKHDLTAQDLAEQPHAFQSWSEAIRICASRIK
ncbi:MAG: NAD(P)/FAD-dependent oxidoreductase [bacterium]|nr:NAD(P)/FAD-dependent oxidoreductase [bacterium]